MEKQNSDLAETVLAIDTATAALVVSIGCIKKNLPLSRESDKFKILASRFGIVGREHLELSTVIINELTKEAGIELAELTAIIVGLGPGSLIGGRVGVIIAKTLSQVSKARLIGISTLDSIAISDNYAGLKVSAIDALKNELYWAFYENNQRISDYNVGSIKQLKKQIANQKALIIGTAIERYGNVFKSWPNVEIGKTLYPAPEGLIKAGISRLKKGQLQHLYKLEPIYLREPV